MVLIYIFFYNQLYIMNINYKDFDYNKDFIPNYNIFNTNTNRFVGIGNHNPNHTLSVYGNTYINNSLFINSKLSYIYNKSISNKLNDNNLSLLKVDSKGLVLYSNIVSSQSSGVKWTVTNNNNIILTLRDINDNTQLDYKSDIFKIENNLQIKISVINNIIIKYILLYDLNDILYNIDLNNVIIRINNISSNIKKNNNGLYELVNYIKLSNNNQYIVEFLNLNITGYIQLMGNYEYQAGSMWINNNQNIYINHNIGIFTNNPKSALHVDGNSYFSKNLNIKKSINTNHLDTNFVDNDDIIELNTIEGYDKLYINNNKKPVNINVKKNENILNIGNNFNINNTELNSKNIIVNNLNNSINTLNINKLNINFEQKEVNFDDIFNDNKSKLDIKNNLIIDKNNLNDNINYDSNYKLYVAGDMYVDGNVNIETASSVNKLYVSRDLYMNHLNSNTIECDFINISSFCYLNSIDTKKICVTESFNTPYNHNKVQNTIYYESEHDCFYYKTSQGNFKIFTSNNLEEIENIVNKQYNIKVQGVTKLNSLNCKIIDINKLIINKEMILNNNAKLYFNVNSLNSEIFINSEYKTFDLLY